MATDTISAQLGRPQPQLPPWRQKVRRWLYAILGIVAAAVVAAGAVLTGQPRCRREF